ncbi:MAG: ribonuclease III [Sphingobacteriales bacterium JAD_PAG50586_3]|nr:MAG: ribonuclease III [Sphingobacteriales bacterium JAD_PAG50586_3]
MPVNTLKKFILNTEDQRLFTFIRNVTGVSPKNLGLYKQAFRHSSVSQDIGYGARNSNERLEFLGDAILSASVANYLFKKFPYRDEGFLTEMRSKIVSRNNLNSLSLKMGFEDFIDAGKDVIRHNRAILGNTFEAFIGAFFLDKGYLVTERFIMKRLIEGQIDIDVLEDTDISHKSKLLNWANRERRKLEINFLEVPAEGEDKSKSKRYHKTVVILDGTQIADGMGISKKEASENAAQRAVRALEAGGTSLS